MVEGVGDGGGGGGGRFGVVKLHYHPQTDSLYIEFTDEPRSETRKVAEVV